MVNDLEWLNTQFDQHGVLVSAYVLANGISHERIQTLIAEGHLHRLSISLYAKRPGKIRWPSIINAIQNQQAIPVRLSGMTSLKVHRVIKEKVEEAEKVQLVSNQFEKLPKWAHEQNVSLVNKVSRIFKKVPDAFISSVNVEGMSLKASCPELALLEHLEQVTDETRFAAALTLMKQIQTLDVELMKALLADSLSEKANRLFLHMAQQCSKHTDIEWPKAFSPDCISLSEEVITVIQDGIVDKQHRITVPAFYPA